MSDSSAESVLLAKLQEYGDSFLEETKRPKKRKKILVKNTSDRHGEPFKSGTATKTLVPHDSEMSRKRRKKARIAHRKNLEGGDPEESDKHGDIHGAEKHIEDMKVKLGLTDEDFVVNKVLKKDVPMTASSKAEVVVFVDPAKKKNTSQEIPETDTKENNTKQQVTGQPEFNLRHARLEVRKFGIQSMRKKVKKRATVDLLMKLGAAAPKKEYVNYRVYQEDRKRHMAQEREKREQDRLMGFKVKKVRKKKRDKNDIVGRIDGQVGKYKHGVQFVNEDDTMD